MKTLSFLIAFSLVGCVAAPSTYVAPPIVDGCTIDIQMPVCSVNRPRPYFASGADAGDLAVGYENVKGELLRAENCIAAMTAALSEWRMACIKNEVTHVRPR